MTSIAAYIGVDIRKCATASRKIVFMKIRQCNSFPFDRYSSSRKDVNKTTLSKTDFYSTKGNKEFLLTLEGFTYNYLWPHSYTGILAVLIAARDIFLFHYRFLIEYRYFPESTQTSYEKLCFLPSF